jgi:hypothetical protein
MAVAEMVWKERQNHVEPRRVVHLRDLDHAALVELCTVRFLKQLKYRAIQRETKLILWI